MLAVAASGLIALEAAVFDVDADEILVDMLVCQALASNQLLDSTKKNSDAASTLDYMSWNKGCYSD